MKTPPVRKKPPLRRPRRAAPPPPARLLAAALGALGEGVLLTETRWRRGGLRIIFANDRLCAMTGFTAAALRGRPHGWLHLERAHFAEIRRWLRHPAAGVAPAGEGYLIRQPGDRLYAAWTFSAVPAARGRAAHVAITYRDMTAKRRLQEELVHAQRIEAVGRLAGGVAHDFNNLLSVINGYCEILGSKPSVRRQAAREIEEIHRAGRHAAGLVRQLLAFSRAQALQPQIVSLNRLVRDNADILTKLLRPDKTLALDLQADPDRVRVDPAQLQQVLLNLTLNARDALAPGGQAVIRTAFHTISRGRNRRLDDLPPGRYVVLTVSDNGLGMDESLQAHLFEPFFTTKEPGKGTGLGLALVYGVVQQSGGRIFVRSAPGAGATFEIFLPAVTGPVRADTALPFALPATRGRETILLIEEDTVVRKMVAGILTADGYRVLAAAQPGEGSRLALAGRPVELLITPLGAAGDDSEKLARALHASHPGLRVLATGGAEPPGLAWLPAVDQGALVKPFALSELLRAVRSLLDGKGVPTTPRHYPTPG